MKLCASAAMTATAAFKRSLWLSGGNCLSPDSFQAGFGKHFQGCVRYSLLRSRPGAVLAVSTVAYPGDNRFWISNRKQRRRWQFASPCTKTDLANALNEGNRLARVRETVTRCRMSDLPRLPTWPRCLNFIDTRKSVRAQSPKRELNKFGRKCSLTMVWLSLYRSRGARSLQPALLSLRRDLFACWPATRISRKRCDAS